MKDSQKPGEGDVTRAAEKENPQAIVVGRRGKKCLKTRENLKVVSGLVLG